MTLGLYKTWPYCLSDLIFYSCPIPYLCSIHTSLHIPSISLPHTLCMRFSSTYKTIWKRNLFFFFSGFCLKDILPETPLFTIIHKIILPSDPCPASFPMPHPLPCFVFITLINIWHTLIHWCIIGILAWVYWCGTCSFPIRRGSMRTGSLVPSQVLSWHRVNSTWGLSGKKEKTLKGLRANLLISNRISNMKADKYPSKPTFYHAFYYPWGWN